ncbi:MAG: hypothetical protein HOG79_11605, partial [Prolixibacteraceae bacterium]|nr:hypothetical protein [Prolixibacteraceae bacterium]
GANQRVITVVAAFVLLAIIWAKYLSSKKTRQQNLYLTVSGVGLNKPALEKIDAIVQQSFKASKLVRYDETSETIETAFWVEIKNTENLQDFKNQLNEINPEIRVSFVDNNSF